MSVVYPTRSVQPDHAQDVVIGLVDETIMDWFGFDALEPPSTHSSEPPYESCATSRFYAG